MQRVQVRAFPEIALHPRPFEGQAVNTAEPLTAKPDPGTYVRAPDGVSASSAGTKRPKDAKI